MFWRYVSNAEAGILMVCNSMIMMIVVAAVVMRYVLEKDFSGFGEIVRVLALWLYFIGAAHGSYEQSHIQVNFVDSFLGETRLTRAIRMLRTAIELFVLCVMTYWTWLLIEFTLEFPQRSPGLRIPEIIPNIALLVGFVLMLVHTVRHALRDFVMQPRQ